MIFGSDNWAGAAPEISEALLRHSEGLAVAYGDSDLDKAIEKRFAEIFETECAVYFVGTGTAANSLAIAATMKPGGIVLCHNEAHVVASEGGAPEFLSGGGRLATIGGKNCKIDPQLLDKEISEYPHDFNHLGQATMVTITQSTEAGTVYSLDEISELSKVAQKHNIPLHMDGARFANALVKLDCTPAEMTWKRGVEMVSFGATKNGCWCAEALVVFNRDLLSHFQFIRKRSGHLFSKTRFISAQFDAYFQNDLWLKLAKHSNAMGSQLEKAVRNSNHVRAAWPTDSNQVFFIADKEKAQTWLDKGARFHPFPTPKGMEKEVGQNEQVYRLVASFATQQESIDELANLISA
jgi:threonine aldolase